MLKAEFIERKNRFSALVKLGDDVVEAHVANSGRLKELFQPGHEVYLERKEHGLRKTKYDLALVRYNGFYVSVNAHLPNKIIRQAIQQGELPPFLEFKVERGEVSFGESRLDLLLSDENQKKCYVEVKSVTLVIDGVAKFPDAPTTRGTRHLGELARAISEGHRAAVVFLIQREDAESFTPNASTDPDFALKLREVSDLGVEVYAFVCKVDPQQIRIVRQVPVRF